jgi:hypothetical protein
MDDAIQKRTAVLFGWLNQVKADGGLIASCFKVAYELTQWTNGEAFAKDGSLIAWPSLKTIATAIAMSERTVRDMVKRLEARGYLSIKVGHGPGHPSLYTLVMKNRQYAAAFDEIGTNSEPISEIRESGSPLPLLEGEHRQPAATEAAVQRHESGSRLPTNHLEPFLNHESERARATFLPNDFRLDDATLSWALDRFQNDRESLDRSIRRFMDHHARSLAKRQRAAIGKPRPASGSTRTLNGISRTSPFMRLLRYRSIALPAHPTTLTAWRLKATYNLAVGPDTSGCSVQPPILQAVASKIIFLSNLD